MKSGSVRHYLMMSLEFGAYCVLMTLLSYLMVLLVMRAPQPNSGVYIAVALMAALLTGLHAGKMFRMYRIALLRLQQRAKKPQPTRHWSDRIAAEETVRRQASLRERLSGEDASPELQAIRLRIAERMAREDRERDELAKADRERIERDRIERVERARSERIREEAERKTRSKT
ncbi:hypothetical protein [Sphingomonas sp. TDK1]|uniref:hypothetical protein n=1 Tax=Sphingomonas sp. TDK1 TaxID=453247 RepID=UPI0007D9B11A|nr:hypothetical protein [Sphingomonas sp. TDK1]OAN57199.1 hypothetical protein A7X12_08225 [Sphingomonas sp. TDK1]